jgi:hypothetical protein
VLEFKPHTTKTNKQNKTKQITKCPCYFLQTMSSDMPANPLLLFCQGSMTLRRGLKAAKMTKETKAVTTLEKDFMPQRGGALKPSAAISVFSQITRLAGRHPSGEICRAQEPAGHKFLMTAGPAPAPPPNTPPKPPSSPTFVRPASLR